MTQDQIYQNIAQRTGGDIYIGVVGPVRSGKSSFIKRFAELMLLPRIKNEAQRARAKDELPQSAAGRTIMTTEPKFIPEKAVSIDLKAGGSFRARLIDCVGYMVDGALGHEENNAPRLVKSPWFDQAVPFDQAAETGTRRAFHLSLQQLRQNEAAFQQAQEDFAIERTIYEHAALMCHCRAILRELRGSGTCLHL